MDTRVLRMIGAANAWIYRATGGKWLGRFPGGAQVCLLTTTGRRSGRARTVPLLYLRDEEDYVVVASQGGAPRHPGWYVNLRATPAARLQIGADTIDVTARTVAPEDRAALWPRLVALYPPYDAYQRHTTRAIPVVRLTPA